MSYSYIDENYAKIMADINDASRSSPSGVAPDLLAVIKSAEVDEIAYLVQNFGIKKVGENRVQQLLSRYDELTSLGVEIHFIGSLQTNKVKYIIDKVKMIHSLDRVSLAEEIDKQAKRCGIIMDVLVEINSGREDSKGGVLPENLYEFCQEILPLQNINLRGFMTMGPKCEENSEYLKYFCETYQLVLDIWQKKLHNIDVPILSMGMSDSLVQAIEAGSTMVRVGKNLFIKKT